MNDEAVLDLSSQGLQSAPDLSQQTSLTEIRLDQNQLSTISRLPPLVKSLSLRQNRIAFISNIDKLSALQVLDLTSNRLISLEGLEACDNLRELYLGFNYVGDDQVQLLSKMRELKVLDLSHNHLRDPSITQVLRRLPCLEALQLSSNDFTEFKVSGFERLRHLIIDSNKLNLLQFEGEACLECLSAKDNCLSEIRQIESLRTVKEVYLDSNDFTELAGDWRALKHLEVLSLSYNKLLEVDNVAVLGSLNVSHNYLKSLAGLCTSPYIQAVIASHNEISELGFTRLTQLNYLDVSYNWLNSLDNVEAAPKLRTLLVAGNRLNSSPLYNLSILALVAELDLRYNPYIDGLNNRALAAFRRQVISQFRQTIKSIDGVLVSEEELLGPAFNESEGYSITSLATPVSAKRTVSDKSGASPTNLSLSPSVSESASRLSRYPRDKALIAEDLLRGSLATEQSVYSDFPRMSQIHCNSLASYDSFLFQESSVQAFRFGSPSDTTQVFESYLNSPANLREVQRSPTEVRFYRPKSRNELPEQRSPVPILPIAEEDDSNLLQTFAVSSKKLQERSAIFCEDMHSIEGKPPTGLKREEKALELKIEQLFNKTKELESQQPSSRTEMKSLKHELRKKLKKYRSLAKKNMEGTWTEEILDLFAADSRRSSKRCCRHSKSSKRGSSVQTDYKAVTKRDACLSPIKLYNRESSTSTGSWGLPRPETPMSDVHPLEELPIFSSRYNSERPEALSTYNSERSTSSLKRHLQAVAKASSGKTVALYLPSEGSLHPSSSRSNVSLATYATTPPRPIFNSEADSSVVAELKPRHSEYGQVASLLASFNCAPVIVKKTFTFSLQKAIFASWLERSSSSYGLAQDACLYFYVAPVLVLEKIFHSPMGFASVYSDNSPIALTSEPTGESFEMICMTSNAEKRHSRWQAEAKSVLPVYLVEYERR